MLAELAGQIGFFFGFILVGYLISRFSGKGRLLNDYLTALLIKLPISLLVIYTLLTASPDTYMCVTFGNAVFIALPLVMMFMGERDRKKSADLPSASGCSARIESIRVCRTCLQYTLNRKRGTVVLCAHHDPHR
ncbi:hypothetical protein [[Eubacterium] cellulosolvens]